MNRIRLSVVNPSRSPLARNGAVTGSERSSTARRISENEHRICLSVVNLSAVRWLGSVLDGRQIVSKQTEFVRPSLIYEL